MIELGSMAVRDHESVTDVREKILGLMRAFRGPEILATRTATAVSEMTRASLAAGGAFLTVSLVVAESGLSVKLAFHGVGAPLDPGPLRAFFDRVASAGAAAPEGVAVEVPLPAMVHQVDSNLIVRERARLARKSRSELMEELRIKNRELEEHNDRLEVTVSERTAELRLANVRMQRDLDAGAAYVRALIPSPMREPVTIGWRYIPSSSLGGDTIGYHWLDDGHLAMYLIDVTGHGLDSALLAVTITNVVRSGTLSAVNMRQPGEVVAALNNAFQGDRHGLKFFTIWYGVYEPASRQLFWSGGGHHPAVLLMPDGRKPALLESSGPIMGCEPGMEFPAETCVAPGGSRLLLFSDGLFEILRNRRVVWTFQGLIDYLSGRRAEDPGIVDALIDHARRLRGDDKFDDDLSIIDAFFD